MTVVARHGLLPVTPGAGQCDQPTYMERGRVDGHWACIDHIVSNWTARVETSVTWLDVGEGVTLDHAVLTASFLVSSAAEQPMVALEQRRAVKWPVAPLTTEDTRVWLWLMSEMAVRLRVPDDQLVKTWWKVLDWLGQQGGRIWGWAERHPGRQQNHSKWCRAASLPEWRAAQNEVNQCATAGVAAGTELVARCARLQSKVRREGVGLVVASRVLRDEAIWSARGNVTIVFRLLNMKVETVQKQLQHHGKWLDDPTKMCVAIYEVLAQRGVEDRPSFWGAVDLVMALWCTSHPGGLVSAADCENVKLPLATRACGMGPGLISRALMALFPPEISALQERAYQLVTVSAAAWTHDPEISYATHLPKRNGSNELTGQRLIDMAQLDRK